MLPFCKDGDLDLVVGEYNGYSIKYYRNTGSSSNPLYSELTGGSNPFNGALCPACLDIGCVCA